MSFASTRLLPQRLSPPSSKSTTTSGGAAGMIVSSNGSSVGTRGQKNAPLVLSVPEISESEVDRIEEAVKDFKRVSICREEVQYTAMILAFFSLYCLVKNTLPPKVFFKFFKEQSLSFFHKFDGF